MHPIKFSIAASHDIASADPKLTYLNGDLVDGQIIFTAGKDEGSLTANVVTTKVLNFQILAVWVLQFYMLLV